MAILVREALKNYYFSDINTKIDLDRAIRTLHKYKDLDETDLKIIDYFKQQFTPSEIGDMLQMSRATAHRRIRHACYGIAKILGISYQDFKIILMVESRLKRKLDEDERKLCWYIIKRHGVKTNQKLCIYNFKILRDGKIVVRDE